MFKHWIKKLGSARLVAMAVMSLFLGSEMLTMPAEARFGRRGGGGGFSSFGNRGSRTNDSGRMQSIPPSTTNRNPAVGANNRSLNNNRGSWLQRNPLLGGLMAGLAGSVLGSMLMNALGFGGGMGGILMALLVGVAIFMLVAAIRNRKQPQNYATAAGGPGGFGQNPTPFGGQDNNLNTPTTSMWDARQDDQPNGGYDPNRQTREQGLAAIALEDPRMTQAQLQDELSARFFAVQDAWSAQDRNALADAATPDMYREFIGDLDDMGRRGERNVIKNIVIRNFDITEAWTEGEVEYATAHITARLLDYVERNGQVVEGDPRTPVNFSEYWTFVRPRGRGDWKLTAVNQEA